VKFTVIWTPNAERDLAELWLDSAERNPITSASSQIDKLLARDPASRGKLRFDTVRELVVPPLGVDFDVQEDDRIVYVLSVWWVQS
jgi:hypothetical protein